MSYIKLANIIQEINIQKGDTLLISSDMRRILCHVFREERGADLNVFIESIQQAVGPEGTLLFPTYNWDFCNGIAFDYRNTESRTGALSKAALNRADFRRTKHPIYSFAVWGKDAETLCALGNKSAFGSDSPFGYLHKVGAKNLIIDLSYQGCFTYAHYVEQQTEGVIYRYHKEFTADYIDSKGTCELRTYSMFVRKLDLNVVSTIDPMEPVFLERGAAEKYKINGLPYKLVDLAKVFPLMQEDIRSNRSRRICTYIGQDEEPYNK